MKHIKFAAAFFGTALSLAGIAGAAAAADAPGLPVTRAPAGAEVYIISPKAIRTAPRHGSGFPLPPWRGIPTDATNGSQLAMDEKAREYSTHPWNVNNMPYNKGSALRYMDVDELITGVMVPWLYVGSCLSAFCWHIEDHSLYSINYLHMGAHKVWYSVPADAAEKFEAAMHDALPHLFQEDPQLLHRLVTMLAPSELMARGVPVHRVVHEAGSFVITFPNAYHCGFNCGFNCAEAVNFAPADWLPFGGNVVSKYRVQAKAPTLSFDALLIRLVSTAPVVHEAHAAAALRPPPTTTTEGGAPLKLTDGSEHATACAGHSSPASASACAAGAGRCVSREQGAGGLAGGGGGGGGSGAMGTDEQPGPESGAAADELPPPKGASRMQPVRHRSTSAPAPPKEGSPSAPPAAGDAEGTPVPHSWRAGVSLADMPVPIIAHAVGELAVRLTEERRRQAIGRAAGVTRVRAMQGTKQTEDADGNFTNTDDKDCERCKCDLFLSSVVSPLLPGKAVCPEHAAALGVPVETCTLLLRYTVEELQERVDTAVALFPLAGACIADAHSRVSTRQEQEAFMSHINALGPIWRAPTAATTIPTAAPLAAATAIAPARPSGNTAAQDRTANARACAAEARAALQLAQQEKLAAAAAAATCLATSAAATAAAAVAKAAALKPLNDEAIGLRLTHVSAPLQLQLPSMLQPHAQRVAPSPAPPMASAPSSSTQAAPAVAPSHPDSNTAGRSSHPHSAAAATTAAAPVAAGSRVRTKPRISSSEEDGSGGESDTAGGESDGEWETGVSISKGTKRVRAASQRKSNEGGSSKQQKASKAAPAATARAASARKAPAPARAAPVPAPAGAAAQRPPATSSPASAPLDRHPAQPTERACTQPVPAVAPLPTLPAAAAAAAAAHPVPVSTLTPTLDACDLAGEVVASRNPTSPRGGESDPETAIPGAATAAPVAATAAPAAVAAAASTPAAAVSPAPVASGRPHDHHHQPAAGPSSFTAMPTASTALTTAPALADIHYHGAGVGHGVGASHGVSYLMPATCTPSAQRYQHQSPSGTGLLTSGVTTFSMPPSLQPTRSAPWPHPPPL
ncbi:MAG: hypothetical protein WDW36_006258 [Sanguina aurantia]